ncbi:von Willebrand factor type A domain protein [Bacillus sp. THAF10]|uniref:vWA domain-containing protein n=1 Tax=Bacillus sp. THAF10 TaxID=2587848 RepID=UPI001267CD46|nr:VWA domain-containing protein [Bacillus sp. THAF10]QFT87764.1 von Willebrand factor type A domain protein [Bacillus sp. THAF10]
MRIHLEKKLILFLLLSLILVLAGCQEDSAGNTETNPPEQETPSEEKPNEKDEEEQKSQEETDNSGNDEQLLDTIINTPPIPETIEGVVNYPIGELAHIKSTTEEAGEYLKEIPPLSEDASEEEMTQYVNYIYALFKVDYESPDSLLESMEIMNADNPDEVTNKELQKDQYNVIIALDASGSMANYIGDKTMMDIAKEAINEYVGSLPENANVGLRVYGHEGTGSDADKQLSCDANELIYELGSFDKSSFETALNPIKPAGWTPLASALEQSAEDLKKFSSENSRNVIYFVSDGIETCDGNPVEAAKAAKASGMDPIVNIIGFGVNNEDSKKLKEIADAAGGNYADVHNQSQLNEQFSKSVDEVLKWQAWHTKSQSEVANNYHENFFGLNAWENKWMSKNIHFSLSASTAITILSNENLITYDQKYWMDDLLKEKFKKQEKLVKNLYNKLFELNKENYNNKMDEIYKIYKKNSQ